MNTRLCRTLCLVVLCLMTRSASGQSESNGLAISVDPMLIRETDKKPEIIVFIHLVNLTNHDVTVPTSELGWSYGNMTGDPNVLDLTANVATWPDPITGRLVIPSPGMYLPVTLRPDEEAYVYYVATSLSNSQGELTDPGKLDDLRVNVTYAISGELAGRAGWWHGTVASGPVQVRLQKHLNPFVLGEVRTAGFVAVVSVSNVTTNAADGAVTADAVVRRAFKGALPERFRIRDEAGASLGYASAFGRDHLVLACLKPAGDVFVANDRNGLCNIGGTLTNGGFQCTSIQQALTDIQDLVDIQAGRKKY